jgi:hypothetical protein
MAELRVFGAVIPELHTDPSPPVPQSTWVLATVLEAAGSPMGLLLSLTYGVDIDTYQLSYRTLEGTTIRTVLS